jgi:hypothetical protein
MQQNYQAMDIMGEEDDEESYEGEEEESPYQDRME